MTPTIYDKSDELFFHKSLKKACDRNNEDYYKNLKKTVMSIFIYHTEKNPEINRWNFFDHLNTGDWQKDFNL